jgi:hypothetical protein
MGLPLRAPRWRLFPKYATAIIVLVGGMLAATFLAVFFVPLFYRLIADRKLSEARSTEAMFDEIKESHARTHEELLERARQDEAAEGGRHGH